MTTIEAHQEVRRIARELRAWQSNSPASLSLLRLLTFADSLDAALDAIEPIHDPVGASQYSQPIIREALEWLVNLGYGVGRAGGPGDHEEIETALEFGKAALEDRKNPYAPALPDDRDDALTDWWALYADLLMHVESKLPNESRHDTAKRYIRQAEKSRGPASMPTASEMWERTLRPISVSPEKG